MEPSGIGTTSAAQFKLATAFPHAASIERAAAPPPGLPESELRRNIGEFVGSAFYGTLLREMQDSKIKGKYFHGGRGEEIFRAQFDMELAARMGRSPGDPIANGVFDWLVRNSDRGASTGRGSSDPLQRTNTRRA